MKVKFRGEDPLVMDLTLIKLTGGANLVDNNTGGIYSLGSGELTKILSDASQQLRKTIEATMEKMSSNQTLRVQFLIHGESGMMFLPPTQLGSPALGQKAKFIFSQENSPGNVITAEPNGDLSKQNKRDQSPVIIVTPEGHRTSPIEQQDETFADSKGDIIAE